MIRSVSGEVTGIASGSATRVLYISPNAVGTALVRSQVLSYLRVLRERGFQIDLITFEQGYEFPEGDFPKHLWHPVERRPGHHLFAKAIDVARGLVAALRIVRDRRVGLVHARSYLPAGIAWAVWRLTGVPFLFDMRGFLGEEYVEGGVWTEQGLRYRILRHVERLLLRDAEQVVVLTEAAALRLRTEPRYAALVGSGIAVIPCAVDLDRFRPVSSRSNPPVLVYSGSLGMWYLLDEMLRLYVYARELHPGLRLRILNRGEHHLIHEALGRFGLSSGAIEIRAAAYEEMPGLLAQASVGIALLKQVSSKSGSSPIKVAEYLACGLPVLINSGLGDVAGLVRSWGAGHVLPTYSEVDMHAAAREVVRLLDDSAAREAARRLAENSFDLRQAAGQYEKLYARVLHNHARGEGPPSRADSIPS